MLKPSAFCSAHPLAHLGRISFDEVFAAHIVSSAHGPATRDSSMKEMKTGSKISTVAHVVP